MTLQSHDTSEIEDLIARCALDDRAALEALYAATSAKLFAICLRVLKDRHAAEDALQDVYVKIWYAADRYSVNGLSPLAWLSTIARNAAIDRLRSRRARRETGDDVLAFIAGDDMTGEEHVIARGEARRVAACMDELEADRRAAVRGAYLDGQTYAELANAAGVPLNTMRSWLRRALIALRACMARST